MRNRLQVIGIAAVIGALVISLLGYTSSHSAKYNNLSD